LYHTGTAGSSQVTNSERSGSWRETAELLLRVLEARAPAVTPDGQDGEAPVPREVPVEAEAGDDVPLEWLGIDRPFTPADAAHIERKLGVELEVHR
jgi:hypothetical protein